MLEVQRGAFSCGGSASSSWMVVVLWLVEAAYTSEHPETLAWARPLLHELLLLALPALQPSSPKLVQAYFSTATRLLHPPTPPPGSADGSSSSRLLLLVLVVAPQLDDVLPASMQAVVR